jgi:ParB family chromosome partitioning protein
VVAEFTASLSDALDTRVRIDVGRRKGKITVEFGSLADLERIVALIAPSAANKRKGAR